MTSAGLGQALASRQGYSGEYLASSSSVGRPTAADLDDPVVVLLEQLPRVVSANPAVPARKPASVADLS